MGNKQFIINEDGKKYKDLYGEKLKGLNGDLTTDKTFKNSKKNYPTVFLINQEITKYLTNELFRYKIYQAQINIKIRKKKLFI